MLCDVGLGGLPSNVLDVASGVVGLKEIDDPFDKLGIDVSADYLHFCSPEHSVQRAAASRIGRAGSLLVVEGPVRPVFAVVLGGGAAGCCLATREVALRLLRLLLRRLGFWHAICFVGSAQEWFKHSSLPCSAW